VNAKMECLQEQMGTWESCSIRYWPIWTWESCHSVTNTMTANWIQSVTNQKNLNMRTNMKRW
jgi:hypothetical protein